MDLQSAEKSIRRGAVAGFIVAGLTFLLVSSAISVGAGGRLEAWNDPWNYLDAIIAAVLSFGVLRRSRTAAVILFVYFLSSQILQFVETGRPTGFVMAVVFLFFFGKAIRGTFRYHNIRKEMDPEYRPFRRAMYFLWVPVITLSVLFVSLMILGTLVPTTAVLSGAEIGQGDLGILHAEGIVDQDEQIILFYSAGLFSIREDGNLLTDKRVISYEEEDGRIVTYAAPLPEIANIVVAAKGDLLNDSLLLVTRRDGSSFYLLVSTENGGDDRFLKEVERRISH